MENKRKRYIRIKSDILVDELFVMLDGIDSRGENDMGSILNDRDAVFVSDKQISKTVDDTNEILVPEANVHVASELTEPQQRIVKCYERRENVSLFMT